MIINRKFKPSMDQDNICKFCGTKFAKASTLSTHMCVKKQRNLDSNKLGPRFGFRVFQRYYQLTMSVKRPKTLDEFINSQYYMEFVKFGNHISALKPMYTDQFIDYVIQSGLKIKDWSKDSTYELYIEDFIKKEPANSATTRTINEILEWTNHNNSSFDKFFKDISANESAYLIKTGKISPWVLYLCNSGQELTDRFNEDHIKMVGPIIDAAFWIKKFKANNDDVEYIRDLLESAGL